LSDKIDNVTAAALPNPALSAWLTLSWRANLKPGETVLIMGATGVTGKLAIQLAKHFGAGRVVAAGRNKKVLETLPQLGADVVISLEKSDEELKKNFEAEIKYEPFDIVLDYIWGHQAEVLLDALTGHDLNAEAHHTRYIQIGEMAGATIKLSAATLRSSAIEIYGQGGGSIPKEVMMKISTEIFPQLINLAAEKKLVIDTEAVPLKDIEKAWRRQDAGGKRIVIIP
jgi:NADPH:quinone reductase-like Zn-dependent oxidoreductase